MYVPTVYIVNVSGRTIQDCLQLNVLCCLNMFYNKDLITVTVDKKSLI